MSETTVLRVVVDDGGYAEFVPDPHDVNPEATGVRWIETDWTECFTVIEDVSYDLGGASDLTAEVVTDPDFTGDDHCTCDMCRELREDGA